MTSYWRMRDLADEVRGPAIDTMKALRAQLHEKMPTRTVGKSLVLGTWNIRNFDDNRFGFGPRLDETYFYLAQTIASFDIVAVQEINDNLKPLQRLLKVLGSEWDYVVTDVTHRSLGGNGERLGFLYDRKKMSFEGVAGEIVLHDSMLISKETKGRQFARTPFCCAFQAGWFKFIFATVHIFFGEGGKNSAEYARRVGEIDAIAKLLADRAKTEQYNYVLVGDFNIDELDGKAFNALERHGFTVFKNRKGSNADQTKYFDQISFMTRPGELKPGKSRPQHHDVLNLFDVVFTDAMHERYRRDVDRAIEGHLANARERAQSPKEEERKKAEKQIAALEKCKTDADAHLKYYRDWRTYQISDHLPLWVELDIDFTDAYLDRMKAGPAPP